MRPHEAQHLCGKGHHHWSKQTTATEWETIITNYTSDIGLVFRIDKVLKKLDIKKKS